MELTVKEGRDILVDKLQGEKTDLVLKSNKLRKALATNDKISQLQKQMMDAQYELMLQYIYVLAERISDLQKDK